MSPAAFAAAFAVGLLLSIVLFIVVMDYNAVMALRQRIDKAWSNSATTSCRPSSQQSAG